MVVMTDLVRLFSAYCAIDEHMHCIVRIINMRWRIVNMWWRIINMCWRIVNMCWRIINMCWRIVKMCCSKTMWNTFWVDIKQEDSHTRSYSVPPWDICHAGVIEYIKVFPHAVLFFAAGEFWEHICKNLRSLPRLLVFVCYCTVH